MVNSALSCAVGILLCILMTIVYHNRYFKKFTVKLFHKTPYNDIWHDVFDLQNGSNLKIYLNNKDYYIIGHHYAQEEKGDDSWIAVSAFAKFDINTNEPYKGLRYYLDNNNVKYTIRLKDIEHIEIF